MFVEFSRLHIRDWLMQVQVVSQDRQLLRQQNLSILLDLSWSSLYTQDESRNLERGKGSHILAALSNAAFDL